MHSKHFPARISKILLTALALAVSPLAAHAQFSLPIPSFLTGPGAANASLVLTSTSQTATWTAQSSAIWLQLAQGSTSGTGRGVISYSIAPNAGPIRTGTISAGGQSFTIVQAGAGSIRAIQPLTAYFPSAGAPFGIAANPDDSYITTIPSENGAFKAIPNQGSTGAGWSNNAGLDDPLGVALDSSSNIFITSPGNDTVAEYSSQGGYITHSPAAVATIGIALDPSGHIYTTGSDTGYLYEQDTMTALPTIALQNLNQPVGIAFDNAGNLDIAVRGDGTLVQWNPIINPTDTTTLASGLQGPMFTAVDDAGDIYVSEYDSGTIAVWTHTTGQLTTLSTAYQHPAGIALGPTGDLFVADAGLQSVSVIPKLYFNTVNLTEPAQSGTDSFTIAALPSEQIDFAPAMISDQPWLSATPSSAGGGSGGPVANVILEPIGPQNTVTGQVIVSLTANPNLLPRVGHISVDGQTITVTQAGAPAAANITAYEDTAAPIIIDPLASSGTQSGIQLQITGVTQPGFGHVTINPGLTTLTYTPSVSYASSARRDTFTYSVIATDGTTVFENVTGTITVINPFMPQKGIYTGLVFDDAVNAPLAPAGAIHLALTGTGGFSGKLTFGGVSLPLSGQFDLTGHATSVIQPAGRPAPLPIDLSLAFDLADGTGVSGTFINNGIQYSFATGARDGYYGPTNPDPSAGYYTVRMPAPTGFTGTLATATATVSKGKITRIIVTNGGSGYIAPPLVQITDAKGKDAVAEAVLTGGTVTSINVVKPGKSYSAIGLTVTIDPPAAATPGGTGWATMHIDGAGLVSITGQLPDGTKFASGGSISVVGGTDQYSFYLPLYKGPHVTIPGYLTGTITFEQEANSNCDGNLFWFRPGNSDSKRYPTGFAGAVEFQGGSYATPALGLPLVFTNPQDPTAAFTYADASGSTGTDSIVISERGIAKETIVTGDKLKLTLNRKTGVITGQFRDLPDTTADPVTGVVYQKSNNAIGLFLTKTEAGTITITPR